MDADDCLHLVHQSHTVLALLRLPVALLRELASNWVVAPSVRQGLSPQLQRGLARAAVPVLVGCSRWHGEMLARSTTLG